MNSPMMTFAIDLSGINPHTLDQPKAVRLLTAEVSARLASAIAEKLEISTKYRGAVLSVLSKHAPNEDSAVGETYITYYAMAAANLRPSSKAEKVITDTIDLLISERLIIRKAQSRGPGAGLYLAEPQPKAKK